MDPTSKKQAKTKSKTIKKPFFFSSPQDPIVPSSTLNKITAQYSKWNTNHTHLQRPFPPATADPPARVDTHMQAKAMTLSSNADSLTLSLLKNNHRHRHHHDQQQRQKQQVEMEKKQGKTEVGKERDKMIIPRERDEPKRPSVSLQSTRRKSCDSQMEVGEFFSTAGVKVVAVDMPPFMQIHAVTCALKSYDGLDKRTPKTLAFTLKKEFDEVYGPAWHCIVGTSFGSFVTHSVGSFLYFSMNHHKLNILLFKTTVQRAD